MLMSKYVCAWTVQCGLWVLLRLFLSLTQVTWGTKQTLSEHCNPAFPRFLALGNRLTHSAKRERGGGGRQEEDRRKRRKAGEIKAGVLTNL